MSECSLRGYLFQCVVSSVYRVCHKLIFHVRRCMDSFRDWCTVSAKTWKFTSFLSVFLFLVMFSLRSSFLQSSGFRCRSRSTLL